MQCDNSGVWESIGEKWPNIILAKDADRRRLDGFPYARGYIRNLLTGKDRDETLAQHSFKVGKYLALKKNGLIFWLSQRTT